MRSVSWWFASLALSTPSCLHCMGSRCSFEQAQASAPCALLENRVPNLEAGPTVLMSQRLWTYCLLTWAFGGLGGLGGSLQLRKKPVRASVRPLVHNKVAHLRPPAEDTQMGGCQNYGPLLGTLNIRCRIRIGIQKGTIILTTTHIRFPKISCTFLGIPSPKSYPQPQKDVK